MKYMREQVLLHKNSGELFLLTNITNSGIACEFMFLFNGHYCIDWKYTDFENLGEL
jgi:hypothetical protein